jgi:acetylornithine deacetylase
MSDQRRSIERTVKEHHARYLEYLRTLIQLAAGGEAAVQAWVAEALAARQCTVSLIEYQPEALTIPYETSYPSSFPRGPRTTVIGHFPGCRQGRRLLCFAHPDSEPRVDLQRWQHQPSAGVVEQGRIYGWGVADDLAGIAIMVCALDALLTTGYSPGGDLLLASTPSKRRAQGVIAALDHGVGADGALYLHPAESGVGLREIKALTAGVARFRVTISGRPPPTNEPGHTPVAHQAVNPVDHVWPIYRALHALGEWRARTVQHPRLEQAAGRASNLLLSHLAAGSLEHLDRVSDACVIAGSISFPPGESLQLVQEQVADAICQAAAEDAWLQAAPPQIEWLVGVPGAEVAPDHPLYRTVQAAITVVTGAAPSLNPLHTASDIRNPLLYRGIPAVGIGPCAGDLSQNGRHDEWVDVEDYFRTISVVGLVMAAWGDEPALIAEGVRA